MTQSPDERPQSTLPHVQYKGSELEAARGPGLGCFYTQLVFLVILVIATPLSAALDAPPMVSAVLLFATIGLLLFTGQTIIFLLRLVAAERRQGRRRPMAEASGRSATVGELEDASDEASRGTSTATASGDSGAEARPSATGSELPGAEPPVRQ